MAHNQANTIVGTSAKLTELGITTQLGGSGLSIAEVASVLGRGTLDLGQLCGDKDANGVAQNKINKWAKFKPVRLNNAWDTAAYQNWWKGSNGLCGIDADLQSQDFVFTSFSAFVNRMIAAFNSQSQYYGNYLNWDYAPPRGIRVGYDAEPYRLLDFNGYLATAESPAGNVRSGVYDVMTLSAYDYSILNYGIELSLPVNNLQVTDFGGFSVEGQDVDFEDCYLGILVINTNSGEWYGHWSAATMGATIANLASGDNLVKLIGLPLSGAAVNSQIKAIPFISTIPMTENEFPHGVNNSNIDELETDGDPDTGEMLEGAWLSAFGVQPVNVTLHRFGQYELYLETDVTFELPYVTGTAYVSIDTAQSSAVNLGNIAFGIVTWEDAQAYKSGLITQAQLLARVWDDNTVSVNVTIPANQRTAIVSLPGSGLYVGSDIDVHHTDWVLVGFPPSGSSYQALVSVDLVDTQYV